MDAIPITPAIFKLSGNLQFIINKTKLLTTKVIADILEELHYFPEDDSLYSLTGNKQVGKKFCCTCNNMNISTFNAIIVL